MPDELQHDCTGSTHTHTNLYCLLSMLIPKINSAGWGWGWGGVVLDRLSEDVRVAAPIKPLMTL